VDIVDVGDIGYISIVVIDSPVPVAAIETIAKVAAAVKDSAVEADRKSPISGVPAVKTTTPAPIAGCP
jgi:hypothetical protein